MKYMWNGMYEEQKEGQFWTISLTKVSTTARMLQVSDEVQGHLTNLEIKLKKTLYPVLHVKKFTYHNINNISMFYVCIYT